MKYRPVVLAVLDGWGYRPAAHGNAIAASRLPHYDALLERYPNTLLEASGEAVGLPRGIMGNSEVGHTNLGSGRVVPQGVVVIDDEIARGEFARNRVLVDTFAHLRRTGGRLHLLGLLSDGQVHSSITHLFAIVDEAVAERIPFAIHAFLDGRDTPPRSAHRYIDALESHLSALQAEGAIATLSGRFYAMDRDSRWERTQAAYDLLAFGKTERRFASASDALEFAYARNESDEFVIPSAIGSERTVEDGDACIFFNFRPDRARQLTTMFDKDQRYRHLRFVTMTTYDESFPNPVLFGPRPQHNTFGEVLARAGLRQLRLAETEKYAHVTYFFNGGREEIFAGEERTLVPSDRSVATYDLEPRMKAREITDEALAALASGSFDAIVMNYANADMVGHTGKWEPTIEACEVLDTCIAELAEAVLAAGGLLAITADHGNAEEKIDAAGNPLTAHTTNPVPLILVAEHLEMGLREGGKLGDVAPTLLALMGLPVPLEMTGTILLEP
ncbi:MAG: 2,3-bisphosphoglycerate-independent phosphoglycerate mutase [Candidatus Eremiobacteraeota bacterium]|nr:2,3-bisphosphoglycerate-independent phosphoglycerate mutase [Candidatus Eremiobacteraeota bacterium]